MDNEDEQIEKEQAEHERNLDITVEGIRARRTMGASLQDEAREAAELAVREREYKVRELAIKRDKQRIVDERREIRLMKK